MDRLTAALKARLPLINVTTTDTLNVVAVLNYLTNSKVSTRGMMTGADVGKMTTRYVVTSHGFSCSAEEMYTVVKHHDRCLILVNSDLDSPLIYDGGELPTPTKLVRDTMEAALVMYESTETVDTYLPLIGGLNLKDLDNLIDMTLARDDRITPRGIAESRRLYAPRLKGIEPVSTELTFYLKNDEVEYWVDLNRTFFLSSDEDERLAPRGILLYGPPGVGKTMASKFIAGEFGVPLYRLDLSSMMSKWLGDAERNLKRALTQIEQEEPCVVLIDEIEKAFNKGAGGEHETTGRVLGHLLWWLQERIARVLVIMTTNDKDSIPLELFRPGRIDQMFRMKMLEKDEQTMLANGLLDTFDMIPEIAEDATARVELRIAQWKEEVASHAEVTQMVYTEIKEAAKNHI